MATPFKLKSGNASSFKNLGSSPAKQTPENWNAKGSSGTGPKIESKVDASRSSKVKTQNFRNEANKIKTVSSQTNKGSKVIDASKKIKTQNFRDAANKIKTVSSTTNKGSEVIQQVGKKGVIKKVIGKAASRLIPGLGWGLAAYDAGRWAYKNRKEISKNASEIKKKRVDNPGDHGRSKY